MTAMQSAFERAGLKRYQMEVSASADRFIAAGGTLGEWITVYKLREKAALSGKGHLVRANEGQSSPADARQTTGDASGHAIGDPLLINAAASPSQNGTGQISDANQSRTARPVREPSTVHRAAARLVAQATAITVLDSYKVRDGRSIGDVRFGEVERLRMEDVMHASVWRQIIRAHPNTPHDMKLRDVLKTDELQRMIQRSAEVADAA